MPALLQLPGGQPGALQQRAGLVGVDVQRLARLGGGEEHGQRRAVVGGGQPAGVAVGQHALPVAEQLGPVAADRPAHLPVFLVDRPGLGQQRGGDFARPAGREAARRAVSSARRPEQVDGRRAAGGQVVGRSLSAAGKTAASPGSSQSARREHTP